MEPNEGSMRLDHPVIRPGHVMLRVLDLDESLHFYSEILGLVKTGCDAQGQIYLKAWDERDHSSVVLRESKDQGLHSMAFKVRSADILNRLEHALRIADVGCERSPAGVLAETGDRLEFRLPSGHLIELYAHKSEVGNALPCVDPPVWHRAAERGIGVTRLDHAVLYGPHLEEVRDLFMRTLGFHLTERVMSANGIAEFAVCLSTSSKPADVVFVRHTEPARLHRLAFRVDSTEQVLRAADTFSMSRTLIDAGPFRDPVCRRLSVQAFDPSGIRVEVFCGGYACYPDATPVTWSWKKVGASMATRDQRTRDRLLPDTT